MNEFVVCIKPSARRTNGAVGLLVNRFGTQKHFDTRDDAAWWADGLSTRGESRVWIRTANPNDRSGADAYLVGRRRRTDAETTPSVARRTSVQSEFVGDAADAADVANAVVA